jgi:hypothetical protein
MRYLLGGSMSEVIAGAGAIAVAIAGLASPIPTALLPISVILVGIGLLFVGGAIASRFSTLLHETSEGRLDAAEFGGGLTVQIVGGMGTIALGIISLLQISTISLSAVAAIVAGGAVLLGSGTNARLNALRINRSTESEEARSLAHVAVSSAINMDVLIGLGAVVLGILAVLRISPLYLSLVAMLGLGFSILISGAALTGLTSAFKR